MVKGSQKTLKNPNNTLLEYKPSPKSRQQINLEKSKYDICQNIARYKRLSLKDLAYELGISPSKLDNVLYCRINLLKLDDLASYLEKLQIDFHLKIAKEVKEKRLEI